MNSASTATDGRGFTPQLWADLAAACAAYEPPTAEQIASLAALAKASRAQAAARTYGLPPVPADRRRAVRRHRPHAQPSSEDDVPLAAA